MKNKKTNIIWLFLLLTLTINAQPKANKASMDNFMSSRFGLFIHWGPVALRGTEIGWSRGDQVAVADYDNLYKEFNPVLFNANAMVKVAKDAGMKYLTITAKHHDGFCLWPTAYTNYNIMNSPYQKDIVGELAKACKKQGIKFCIYYSVLDWHHPDYPIHSPKDQTIDPKAAMAKYVTYMKNQLKELIAKYDPYMLWFDGAWEKPWTEQLGEEMYAYLKKLKPTVIINNRLGKEIAGVENKDIDHSKMLGDYDTPEQVVGRMNLKTPWESCFTICNQWAWKANDKMKSLQECLSILSRTVGGNGNLLLNVGPMADGRIEARQVERLREIGNWLKQNGEAVYGTMGGPYLPTADYASTRKGNKIYLHVLNSKLTNLQLAPIAGKKILKASLNGQLLKFVQGDQLSIEVPARLHNELSYIVAIELDGSTLDIPLLTNN